MKYLKPIQNTFYKTVLFAIDTQHYAYLYRNKYM